LLNFLSRLSGVATLTRRFADLLADLPTRIAATRKTDPGMRVLEKQAVVDGGGEPHRMGLYDAVLVKDNHIAAAGGITEAVARVRNKLGSGVYVEVEVETTKQLQEAIDANVNRVMLDNMTPEMVKSCVELAGGRVELEASGGINLDNARDFAEAGADVISLGVITRSAAGIDFSLVVER
jgi:nicotinate-nucleotide pyrophosphorylase (carboxylating)